MSNHHVLVTDIQRFAVNDGPGFRTNVFLKGCPLRCAWCHNPETISPYPDLYWKRRLCVQCGACLEACPRDAINPPIPPDEAQQEDSTYHKVVRSRCDLCMKCVETCRYGALEIVGRSYSTEAILDEVESDKPFYANSGGGMTLSGGEPATHLEYALELLKGARSRGFHTCLDTSGHCTWEDLRRLTEYTDIVLFDVKHLDPFMHMQKVGVSNELILENLSMLSKSGIEIWVRIPVIPEYNDSVEYHVRTADFFAGLPGRIARVDLLPFHNWCQDKYGWLGIDWELKEVEALDPGFIEVHMEPYLKKGFIVTVGGSGFEGTTH